MAHIATLCDGAKPTHIVMAENPSELLCMKVQVTRNELIYSLLALLLEVQVIYLSTHFLLAHILIMIVLDVINIKVIKQLCVPFANDLQLSSILI